MPGVSTRNAIQCNHSRMVQAEAKAGAIEGNPIREDIDEVCERFVPITFIVNVILERKNAFAAVWPDILLRPTERAAAFWISFTKSRFPTGQTS